jgi:hypothetical protein
MEREPMANYKRVFSWNGGWIGIVVLLSWLLVGCKNPPSSTDVPVAVGVTTQIFPEFFLEKGSDDDSTYISFRGRQAQNDSLQLEMTSWGVVEYGLFLQKVNGRGSASYLFMGRCGTVPTRTWKKVTLTAYLSRAEQDTLWSLSFSNWRDSLTIGKTEIAMVEK